MRKLRWSTESALLSTPFKLCNCIFPFSFYFVSLFPIFSITHPLSKNNNNNNNNNNNSLKFQLPSLLLSSFFHYLNYLLLLHASIPFPSLSPPLSFPLSLLFVVAKLNGQPVADTAERGRLHLPVVDRVSKQADAVIESPLHSKSSRAEVIHTHLVDVVGMEVHHLESRSSKVEGE